MASPLNTGKKSVNLAPGEVRVSKIRRDPPPAVKELVVRDPEERDQRDVVIGVLSFALALFVIIFSFASYSGWSLQGHAIEVRVDE